MYDRMFFYLLDQMLMLFLYEKKKNSLNQFFIPAFEAYSINVLNFTSGWVQYCTRWETGDGRAAALSRSLSTPWLFHLFNNPIHTFVHIVFFLSTQKTTKE